MTNPHFVNRIIGPIRIVISTLLFGIFTTEVNGEADQGVASISNLPNPLTQSAVDQYMTQVKLLSTNPQLLDVMPPEVLRTIVFHLYGFYIQRHLSADRWEDLRRSEITLVKLIIVSLDNRIDPSIPPVSLTPPAPYPSYNSIPHPDDPNGTDLTKRRAYEDLMAKRQSEMADLMARQQDIKYNLHVIVAHARYYLSNLFSNELKQGADELKESGYDEKTIKLLIRD